MLTSHSRSHGIPPREPWEFSAEFLDGFRRAAEMKYRLMPYVYAQAKDASTRGLPMTRALFIEYPEDPGSWLVEDEYLFGTDMLVAPLIESGQRGRSVYLPPGSWIDYQTGRTYSAGWHSIDAGPIPIVVLVRDGAVIPHMAVAQSTSRLDWSKLEAVVYATGSAKAQGLVYLPGAEAPGTIAMERRGTTFRIVDDPLKGKATWTVRPAGQRKRGDGRTVPG